MIFARKDIAFAIFSEAERFEDSVHHISDVDEIVAPFDRSGELALAKVFQERDQVVPP